MPYILAIFFWREQMAESFMPSCKTFSFMSLMQKHRQKPDLRSPIQNQILCMLHNLSSFPNLLLPLPLLSTLLSLHYQSDTDLQLQSLSSLHQYKRSNLMRPSVIPLSEKDLPESLKCCNWLPVMPAMNILGQAIHEGCTPPQEESKVTSEARDAGSGLP